MVIETLVYAADYAGRLLKQHHTLAHKQPSWLPSTNHFCCSRVNFMKPDSHPKIDSWESFRRSARIITSRLVNRRKKIVNSRFYFTVLLETRVATFNFSFKAYNISETKWKKGKLKYCGTDNWKKKCTGQKITSCGVRFKIMRRKKGSKTVVAFIWILMFSKAFITI